MDELLQKLQETNRKAVKLERLILRLKEDKKKLATQLNELKSEVASKEEAYSDMVEKYEAVKIVKHLDLDSDRDTIQEKIDLYIKEIDACLKRFGE